MSPNSILQSINLGIQPLDWSIFILLIYLSNTCTLISSLSVSHNSIIQPTNQPIYVFIYLYVDQSSYNSSICPILIHLYHPCLFHITASFNQPTNQSMYLSIHKLINLHTTHLSIQYLYTNQIPVCLSKLYRWFHHYSP